MIDDRREEPDQFRTYLLWDESAGFRSALAQLRLALDLDLAVGEVADPSAYEDPASIAADTLNRHTERIPDESFRAATQWLGGEAEASFNGATYRARAADPLAFGGFLLGCGTGDPDRLAHNLARTAFGVDPWTQFMGDCFGGHPLDLDPPQLPPTLGDLTHLLERTCVAGIRSAGSRFGQVASQRPRPLSGAAITDVDPGSGCAGDSVTISINMDYGFMRAFDEVVADPAARAPMRRLSDEITALRLEIWTAEHFANGQRLPGSIGGQTVLVPDPASVQVSRDNKKLLRSKTMQRIGASAATSVPTYRANWWRQWERHPWPSLIPTPWDAFTSRAGSLPAETPPAP